jgi:hypothetical protein
MEQSPLRLIKRCAEYRDQAAIDELPRGLRGIYVLYQSRRQRKRTLRYDVVYVGMAWAGKRGGIRGRLRSHRRRKAGLWSHFSVFEVWNNIRNEEIRELEGLFRHIYRKDSQANRLNIVRGFKALKRVTRAKLSKEATE